MILSAAGSNSSAAGGDLRARCGVGVGGTEVRDEPGPWLGGGKLLAAKVRGRGFSPFFFLSLLFLVYSFQSDFIDSGRRGQAWSVRKDGCCLQGDGNAYKGVRDRQRKRQRRFGIT